MLRIQIKQNLTKILLKSYLLKSMKKSVLESIMIQRLLINMQIICSMCIKILKSTIQVENSKD